jgi:hypothetical protein
LILLFLNQITWGMSISMVNDIMARNVTCIRNMSITNGIFFSVVFAVSTCAMDTVRFVNPVDSTGKRYYFTPEEVLNNKEAMVDKRVRVIGEVYVYDMRCTSEHGPEVETRCFGSAILRKDGYFIILTGKYDTISDFKVGYSGTIRNMVCIPMLSGREEIFDCILRCRKEYPPNEYRYVLELQHY